MRVANNAAAITLTADMGFLLFLCVLSMVEVACTAATGEGLYNILCYDYNYNELVATNVCYSVNLCINSVSHCLPYS